MIYIQPPENIEFEPFNSPVYFCEVLSVSPT